MSNSNWNSQTNQTNPTPAPDKCRHCGHPAEDHHDFETVIKPKDCVCNPGDWCLADVIPVICNKYIEPANREFEGTCEKCQHELGCHR